MSTLRVVSEKLVIHPHPNADALELAQIGLYRAVVAKGAFQTGDCAVYIPEQAIVPEELLAELNLTGRLGGKQHNRVCIVKLRGEISQGIVCRPRALKDWEQLWRDGTDLAETLGITKWVPEVPVAMSGEVEAATDLLPWVDIENIRRYPGIFEPGEPVVATEKIHGSCCLFTYDARTGTSYVSSKGFGDKRLAIIESDGNLYWRAIRAYGVEEFARKLAESHGFTRVGIFGEVYGAGVQDLGYGANAGHRPGYAVFDLAVELDGRVSWADHDSARQFIGADLPMVPVLYRGGYDENALMDLAEGVETISGAGVNIREGLVVRPEFERHSDVLGGRTIGKFVSTAYLSRKGGTEYE
jgi:RNA ligase (TIGR02306 family)